MRSSRPSDRSSSSLATYSTSGTTCVETITIFCRAISAMIAHRDALPRIQTGRRLIEDENVRLVQNGLRQQQALLHAAGEAADRLAAHVGQADRAERPVDALQRPRARMRRSEAMCSRKRSAVKPG